MRRIRRSDTINNKDVFQRLMLFSVEGYLSDIKSGVTYNYDFLHHLKNRILIYMKTHRFSPKEYEIVKALADTDFMKGMVNEEVDRTIFALEMIYLYVKEIPKKDRALLGISDDKLLRSKSLLITDMLKLRVKDQEQHKRVKDIIDSSRLSAKKYFNYSHEFVFNIYGKKEKVSA